MWCFVRFRYQNSPNNSNECPCIAAATDAPQTNGHAEEVEEEEVVEEEDKDEDLLG
jgi:hypothetical protein